MPWLVKRRHMRKGRLDGRVVTNDNDRGSPGAHLRRPSGIGSSAGAWGGSVDFTKRTAGHPEESQCIENDLFPSENKIHMYNHACLTSAPQLQRHTHPSS